MPLDASGLAGNLNTLFGSPPDNISDCAASWASAMESYTTGIVPASITVTLAANALESNLITTFANNGSPSMLTSLESDFALFASGVALGMIGYNSVPPPGPVGFASIGTQTSNAGASLVWTVEIDTWMRTGVSTLIAPPFTVVPWS